MEQEKIKTEYLTLLQKPFLTEKEIKRGKQLVRDWKRNKYWDEHLKQFIQ